jgi:hypothetical protein
MSKELNDISDIISQKEQIRHSVAERTGEHERFEGIILLGP